MSIIGKKIDKKLQVLTSDLGVPTVDDTPDLLVRDVVGRKTDSSVIAVGTTKSLVGYLKGVLSLILKVPQSDGTVSWNDTALGAVNAEVDTALNTIVPASPTAGSLNDGLSKANSNTYNRTTDSQEMLSDKVGAYTGDGGTGADDSVKAELDLIKAKTDFLTGTIAGTIVQDSAMGTGTPGVVDVVASATANTFGNWIQLDASVSADSWISHVTINYTVSLTSDNACVVEIGTGGAGAEVAKVRFSFHVEVLGTGAYSNPIVFVLPKPIKVTSATRIAARTASSTTNTITFKIGLSMYQGLE